MHDDLSETHILGSKTRQKILRADTGDRRPWLSDAPICNGLKTHRISHAGICYAQAPYRIVRMKQSGTYFMACHGGEGRILVDGKWRVCKSGMACLLPPHMLNAFHAVPGRPWHFVWVRYDSIPETRPLITASSPMLAQFQSDALVYAMEGLYAEAEHDASAAAQHHWIELLQGYVQQFAQPWQMDERLSRLWEQVNPRLSEDWTVDSLAAEAFMSGEHLRRLCVQQLGRPPLRHLTWLRMKRAAELLASTDEKVETVAHLVGYQNPFVFSNTFKKWIGWRPSEHRSKAPSQIRSL